METDSTGMQLTASYTEKLSSVTPSKTPSSTFFSCRRNSEAAKDDEDMDQQKQADQPRPDARVRHAQCQDQTGAIDEEPGEHPPCTNRAVRWIGAEDHIEPA